MLCSSACEAIKSLFYFSQFWQGSFRVSSHLEQPNCTSLHHLPHFSPSLICLESMNPYTHTPPSILVPCLSLLPFHSESFNYLNPWSWMVSSKHLAPQECIGSIHNFVFPGPSQSGTFMCCLVLGAYTSSLSPALGYPTRYKKQLEYLICLNHYK